MLLEDNLFALSAREHSAYVSDGSDDYVIRRNVFYGSNASGLQCNIDAVASLEKLKEHPELQAAGPYKPTRQYALAVLRLAAEKFGPHAFPDGRGFNYIIEDNVINENGRAGGGAINLAGVRESLIQNNLVYGNEASGIVEWDNANPYDASVVNPTLKTAAQIAENAAPLRLLRQHHPQQHRLHRDQGPPLAPGRQRELGHAGLQQHPRQRRRALDRLLPHGHLALRRARAT